MSKIRIFALILLSITHYQAWTQTFSLFDKGVKEEYPSVVYDFLERYLYEIDSLSKAGKPIMQRMEDDKVSIVEGDVSIAASINPLTTFRILTYEDKYYHAMWFDTLGNTILSVAFPMRYELLLGKPKVQIEREMSKQLTSVGPYSPKTISLDELQRFDSNCWTSMPIQHYYVEGLNNACYFIRDNERHFRPVFDSSDIQHSAANLFQGIVENIDEYSLYIEQNLYGFQKDCYRVKLTQWLTYCQAMKLDVYFAVEEERTDGLSALLIAHSQDLGFNHMMSLTIPSNFVTKPTCVIKATLNAYIPTQNIKDLYQKYVERPKKKI